MALSDKWSQQQIRVMVRNELMDPLGTFPWSWTDIEINSYIREWQSRLQDAYEFVWTTATATMTPIGLTTNSSGVTIPAGTASVVIASFSPDALRIDAFYWNCSTDTFTTRLVARTKEDLNILVINWRNVPPVDPPLVVYQDDPATNFVLWPPNALLGTLIAEYPKRLCFVTDTSTMQVPAWTKYSAVAYCAWRAFLRTGPNQDLNRAQRYKVLWERYLMRYRRIWDGYRADRYLSLKPTQPSDHYNIDILNPVNQTIIPP